MSEETTAKLIDLLNEEKWTRAALNSYTVANFEELDQYFHKIEGNEEFAEIKELCDEHIENSKNSIIGLYISGIMTLTRRVVDDSYMVQLIDIFTDNHKWGIVEFLCKRILDFGENKFALKRLSECYANENKEAEKIAIWARLIKVDYEEAEITKKLAKINEDEGKLDEAIVFYKKALNRYITRKMFSNIRDIWLKLLELNKEDYEFFFVIEKKVSRFFTPEKSILLLRDFYDVCKIAEEWDLCLSILKTILRYDPKDEEARQEIITTYSMKYEGHSHLQEYINLSNLNQGWRNILEAISDFEKHIFFDVGNFVSHKTWGVGIIKEIGNGQIVIDFAKKRGHSMSLKMGISSLTGLAKDHIAVLKTIHEKDKLKKKVKSDPIWALKTIIKSYDNQSDMKKIKAELVPDILTPSEWTTWSTESRKILKREPVFGNIPDKVDCFVVRDKPISYEEKTSNKFKAEKNFFHKVEILEEFLENSDPGSEQFNEMFTYFKSFLHAANSGVYMTSSFLYVQKLVRTYPFLNPGISYTFKELFEEIENVDELFRDIDSDSLKNEFLIHVRLDIENWEDIYLALFQHYLNIKLISDLLDAGYKDKVKEKLLVFIDHYKEHREVFFWLIKNAVELPGFEEKMEISYEKVLINLINLLVLTFRDVNNKREVPKNRKLNKGIQNYLFKEQHLENYLLKQEDQNIVIRIFSLLNEVHDIDPLLVKDVKEKILETFTGINLLSDSKVPKATPAAATSKNFYVLEDSLTAKKRELRHILDVEIPKNSLEIGVAIEMGDLKENAEYKAGKEKQENLNITVGKMKDELEKARILDLATLKGAKIGFGVVTELKNNVSDKTETYTILGPWESEPSQNIISYLSPFGVALSGQKKDQTVEFIINERTFNYTVVSVNRYTV